MESTLKVRVYDKDTLSDDILGEYDVNLNLQNLLESTVMVVLSEKITFAFRGMPCHVMM